MSIKQDVARNLIGLVNTLPAMELLMEYVDYRIAQCHKTVSQLNDFNEILRYQGCIRELERFKSLRDEVLNSVTE